MEIMFIVLLAFAFYIVACFVAIKLTVDKLGARSALFGAGIASAMMGFIMHKVIELAADDGFFWNSNPESYLEYSVLYYVLLFGFLILGVSGVVMIAVDLLLMINEQFPSAVRLSEPERDEGAPPAPVQQDRIPAWKRIEMEDQ